MQLDGNTPINLSMTVDMINIILGSLSTQPYERVAGIINMIQQQATAQIAANQPVPDSAE